MSTRSFPTRALNALAALAVLTQIASCGAGGFVVTGQVIDSETGNPMPNVWVHQEWILDRRIKYNWGGSTARGCVDEQVTKTDAQGRFRFEKPPKLNYSVLEYEADTIIRPLIPGHEKAPTSSKDIGKRDETVAVRRSEKPPVDWLRDLQIQLLFGRCPPTSGNAQIAIDDILRSIAMRRVSSIDFASSLGYIDPTRPRPTTIDPSINKRHDLYERYVQILGENK